MRIFTIDTGLFSTDGGAMFGVMSRKVWSSKYPVDNDNRCPLAMRCVFADFGTRKVLFDSGVGLKPCGMPYYRFRDLTDIAEALEKKGYRAEEVTDVVLSHLHFDHCGGCTRLVSEQTGETSVCDVNAFRGPHPGLTLRMTFPNARHWTTQAQWQNSLNPGLWEADAYLPENLEPVDRAGLLMKLDGQMETSQLPQGVKRLSDGSFQLFEGLRLKICEGHTCGQLVSFLESAEGNWVVSGDVIPMCMHVTQGCVAAIDNCAHDSVEEKTRVLQEAVSLDARLAFYHDAAVASASLKSLNGHISPAERFASEISL